MIRRATRADLPRIVEIRDGVGDNPLSDPKALDDAEAVSRIDIGALLLWQEPDGSVTGSAAFDADSGALRVLLVAPGHQGRGIGRALLKAACDALRDAGHSTATLRAEAGSAAEQHYRGDGWTGAGTAGDGKLILQKTL